ncbi:hypothetical protein MKZ38_001840 [Zalerion maritima]|uniref:Uncharacterized protein n=1 Tax=Zalerion maritima TaxID=339359 RepID=A0AAD5WR83_9PEZI|nr:hypothetical protein MKZ38_001840 [Zalerion maritima]
MPHRTTYDAIRTLEHSIIDPHHSHAHENPQPTQLETPPTSPTSGTLIPAGPMQTENRAFTWLVIGTDGANTKTIVVSAQSALFPTSTSASDTSVVIPDGFQTSRISSSTRRSQTSDESTTKGSSTTRESSMVSDQTLINPSPDNPMPVSTFATFASAPHGSTSASAPQYSSNSKPLSNIVQSTATSRTTAQGTTTTTPAADAEGTAHAGIDATSWVPAVGVASVLVLVILCVAEDDGSCEDSWIGCTGHQKSERKHKEHEEHIYKK